MKNLSLSQEDSNPVSSPSPCKILCSSNCFITPWLHQRVFYSPFTPACIYLHATKDVAVLHLTGCHCWLFIYLNEGLLTSAEHSSNGDSLRKDKEKVLRHIKKLASSWWQFVIFQFGVVPCSLFYGVDLWESWFGGDFLASCLSSSTWMKLPGLIEDCLDSCSIYSQKQVASVVGLGPRLPENE